MTAAPYLRQTSPLMKPMYMAPKPASEVVRSRGFAAALGLFLIASLAALEWFFDFDFSLGIAYTLPITLLALSLPRWQIVAFAVLSGYVHGQFTPQHTPLDHKLRVLMATVAYLGVGLLIEEISRNRKAALADMARLQLEQRLRKQAEEQLRLLVESSPAGVLTVDSDGLVRAVNRALADSLGLSTQRLIGRPVEQHLPVLMHALRLPIGARHMRTATSGWARREDGSMFPVMAWLSTYTTDEHRYLAAIVVDMSDEVRERERENYRHLHDAQRLLAGAVSHEIRNMCSAISVVTANIERRGSLAALSTNDPDWMALKHLTDGLSNIASFELKVRTPGADQLITLPAVLDQLRLIMEQDFLEDSAQLDIQVPLTLPPVQADAHGLLQVFLNLAQNTLRALANSPQKILRVNATEQDSQVCVSFVDTGPGIANIEGLFHPFRPGADGTGLGLYVSRTLMRSFGGDLVFVPTQQGCRFDLYLSARGADITDAPVSDR